MVDTQYIVFGLCCDDQGIRLWQIGNRIKRFLHIGAIIGVLVEAIVSPPNLRSTCIAENKVPVNWSCTVSQHPR